MWEAVSKWEDAKGMTPSTELCPMPDNAEMEFGDVLPRQRTETTKEDVHGVCIVKGPGVCPPQCF